MKQQDIATGFQDVDHGETEFLINFISHINQFPSVQECLKEQLSLLDIQEGHYVLDVGCGIGNQALEMAKKVGHSGKAIGTDMSESMIETSQKRHSDSGLPLTFQIASATEQPFPDTYFDRIRTERVLLYVHDIDQAFKEFYRLLKPRGKFLVFDINMDAMTIAHTNKKLTREIVAFVSDSFPNGRIGADLPHHFNHAKFKDIQVKHFGYMVPLDFFKKTYSGTIATGVEKGVFEEAEIEAWWNHLEQENTKGSYLASVSGFLVMGTK